jgi:hypothetical protein
MAGNAAGYGLRHARAIRGALAESPNLLPQMSNTLELTPDFMSGISFALSGASLHTNIFKALFIMKILTIHFSYLRNEAHYRFLLLVKKLIESHTGVAGIVGALLPELYALLTVEGKLVDTVHASTLTKQLAEIDRRLDRVIAGLILAIRAALHHSNPDVVNAAERLRLRLKAFRNGIERKAYEEVSAAVKILVADLQGDCEPQVSLLNFGVWVTGIAAAQSDFEQVFLQRSAEHAARPQENLKDIRRKIDAVYRRIIERVNAYTVLNGTETTGDFISKLNGEIIYFNEYNRHHHPKDINTATVAAIPNQLWDGRPVTPQPSVTDENGNELVFARDYDLTCHRNDQPGNAFVTIHGKGAWKNKKTVSFNIIEISI